MTTQVSDAMRVTTALDATKLTGNLPAISGASLTDLPASGLYSSVAMICDQKASGTLSGSFTSGAWRTRDVNTEISDADGIVSISANNFTLQAGTYTLEWSARVYFAGRSRSRCVNVTDSNSVVVTGTSSYTVSGTTDHSVGMISNLVISVASAFKIQHYCDTTKVNNGFGVEGGALSGGDVEKYLMVKIYKHS